MNHRPLLNWIELSVSERWAEAQAHASVHPLNLSDGQECFAISLDGRWLSGSSGALSCFDTKAAAARFLKLLNMDGYVEGERSGGDDLRGDLLQCFHLNTQGLKACDGCHAGREAHALALREFGQSEDRW